MASRPSHSARNEKFMNARPLFILLTLLSAGFARAELRLAPLFRDHAVLQQGKPVPVWGWAEPGRAVKVAFHEHTAKPRPARMVAGR